MSKLLTRLIAPCILLTAYCSLLTVAWGQSSTATLSGTIEDQNGAVIPAVSVSVENVATRIRRTATTNESGSFTIPLLPPGEYTVLVEREGFTRVQLTNIVLNVGDQKAVQVQLKVGDVASTVEVRPDATLIRTDGSVGTVVDRTQVENMPLNGRSFQSLITLSPGVVLTKATFGEQGQFSVNGQRADSNYFTVDGVSGNISISAGFNLGQSGGGSLPGLSASGGTNNLVSVDGLQEFKIQTSTFAPEFGRTPGAQIQIVTRSGTNEFRGTLFEYFRNDVLDSTDWFANSRSLPKAALRQNDFGFVLGGPVLLPRFGESGHQPGYDGHNRTFFFFSYEGLRLRLPQTAITDVPSLEARQTAPIQVRPLLNAFPLPNGPTGIGANGLPNGFAQFSTSFSNPSSLNATSVRIDHTVSGKVTLFGRYNYAPSESVLRGSVSSSSSSLSTSQFNTQTLTIGSTQAITPAVSNDFRFNYSRNRGATYLSLDDLGGAIPPDDSILFPAFTSPADGFFSLSLSGGLNTRYSVGRNVDNLQRQVNAIDNLSIIAGTHQLKFGVDYRRLSPVFGPRSYTQVIRFSSIGIGLSSPPAGSVFSGKISSGFISAQERVVVIFQNFSVYAQDNWRVNRRLSLTYGARWELNPPPRGASGNDLFTVQGLDNLAAVTLAPRGTPLYRTTYDNIAARSGFAYRLSESPGRETMLRGGFGIFYDLGNQTAGGAASAFPNVREKNLPSGTPFPITDTALLAPPPFSINPPFPSSIIGFDPNFKLPRTYQWNVTVERSLGSDQVVSASYVAALGRQLLRTELIKRPNLNFSPAGQIQVTRNAATSDYHAMQLQFQRRSSRGLQALASYTWSKSIDIASADSFPNPPGERISPRQDRGPSDFDVRHAFNAAVTYDIPKPRFGTFGRAVLHGWSVDTVVMARSATPVNLFYSRDIGFGFFSFRPDLLPGVPLYVNDPLAPGGRQINRLAVSIPTFPPGTIGRQGTLGRNALRGFPIWQLDLALRRQFNLTERLKLQLRTEFFNLFNHPNFSDPIGNLDSSSFGRSTSMLGRSLGSGGTEGGFNPLYQVGGPRSVQLAVKLMF